MDIDIKGPKGTNKDLEDILKNYNDTFYVDETMNGYHIFVLNRRSSYNDPETINYMINFGNENFKCDIKYILCVYLRGFCVRLNKKNPYDPMYKHVGIYGCRDNVDKDIMKDIKLLKDLVSMYKNIYVYSR